MRITVELSLYPLQADFVGPITDFIHELRREPDIEMVTNQLSTQLRGEFAAMVIVDAVARLIPGVLGDGASVLRESFMDGMLDHPQYTRPAAFRGMKVPEVLLSGDHREIEAWRTEQAALKTRGRRPDLPGIASDKID